MKDGFVCVDKSKLLTKQNQIMRHFAMRVGHHQSSLMVSHMGEIRENIVVLSWPRVLVLCFSYLKSTWFKNVKQRIPTINNP